MQTPENLSLIILFLLAAFCLAGAFLPVEIEVGEAPDEEEIDYSGTAADHRFASRNASRLKSGAAMTSEM
jgi:hypothetical protein